MKQYEYFKLAIKLLRLGMISEKEFEKIGEDMREALGLPRESPEIYLRRVKSRKSL